MMMLRLILTFSEEVGMTRIAAICCVFLVWLLQIEETDTWTAWLYGGGEVILINEQGDELQRITLPVMEDQHILHVGAAHNGLLIAYISINESSYDAAQVRVYDTQTNQLRVDYSLSFNTNSLWNGMLLGSSNFNADDTLFAVGQNNGEEGGWSILVFDLATGEVIQILTADRVPRTILRSAGIQPLIYRFADDTITFAAVSYWDYPSGPESAFRWSINWHLPTDSFSENCLYTHLNHGTFDPTGEVIESAIHPYLGYVPDSDIQGDGPFALEFYDTEAHWRQVFYGTRDFLLYNPTFVQNGERIVVWGDPSPDGLGVNRLVLIERDGIVVDQADIVGSPFIRGTNDGFVHITFYDVSDWVSSLTYVNTRGETPFAHQSVIWESQPNQYLKVVWAASENPAPLASFMPWGNRMTYDPDCRTSHG
jgi:hypothetical protein